MTTSGAVSLLTGHGSLRASLTASQRKSVLLLTGSQRASLVLASSGSHSSLHASLPASQHASLTVKCKM